MDGFINIYIAFILFFVVAYLLMILFYVAIGILIMIPFLAVSIIISVFYYKMAKKAGYKKAWIAFLPYGKSYLAFTIPHREYNLGIFKTKRRKRVFWISFVAELAVHLITGVSAAVLFIYAQSIIDYNTTQPFAEIWSEPVFVILYIISFLFGGIVFILRSIVYWRKNYDLLKTYGYGQFAVWGALLNVICPLVMVIMPILMAGRAPDYGLNNYYLWEESDVRYI